MQKIKGAKVKAAALAHANKQLRNLGVAYEDGTGSVQFSGGGAYASWEDASESVLKRWLINYPDLPDNGLISRAEADLISAYTLHEIGHIAFTRHVQEGGDALLFYCWNGIEDARIEHAVIASGKARGARSMFKKLIGKFTAKVVAGDDFNPCSINSAPFALALVCRAALGDGNGFAKQLLSRIPEPHQSLYRAVVDGMAGIPLDRSGSRVARQLAEQFVDSWKQQFPAAFKPSPDGWSDLQNEPEDGNLSGDEQGEHDDTVTDTFDAGFGDPEDGDDGELAGDGDGDDFSAEGDDESAWGDDESAWGDVDGEGGDQASDEAERETDALLKGMQDAAEPTEDDSLDGILGSGGDDSDDDDDVSVDDLEQFSAPRDDRLDADKIVSPEPNVDEVFQSCQQRTKQPINLPSSAPAARSDMRKWQIEPLADRAHRNRVKKYARESLPAMRSALHRILKAPERCGWDGGATGGRFDGKRAPRMFAGSEQVFKRRWAADGIDTAVSVVIDLSGSMKGDPIKQAVSLGWSVASACESAGAKVEVCGFVSSSMLGVRDWSGGRDLQGIMHYARTARCGLAVAKRFRDRCAESVVYFERMKSLPRGGTPDYEGIKTVAEQLSAMPQQRKIVVVITDGIGHRDEMLALTSAAYELYGVDIIGFGINTLARHFAQAYAVGCPVSLDELHGTALKSVIKQLQARDPRRVM